MNSINNLQKIKKLEEEAEQSRERINKIKSMSIDVELAELLHEKLCRSDHTDHCGWYYDSWSGMGVERNNYLEKSRNILKIVDIGLAEKIINCL